MNASIGSLLLYGKTPKRRLRFLRLTAGSLGQNDTWEAMTQKFRSRLVHKAVFSRLLEEKIELRSRHESATVMSVIFLGSNKQNGMLGRVH